MVGGALHDDRGSFVDDLRAQSQCMQGTHGITGEVDTRALAGRAGRPFDDLHGGTPAAKRTGGGESGDARADNKNPNIIGVDERYLLPESAAAAFATERRRGYASSMLLT